MNRFTAAGLIAEAESGKTIVVLRSSMALRRADLEELTHQVAGKGAVKVCRALGDESISFPSGGWIGFTTPHDLVFVRADAVLLASEGDDDNPGICTSLSSLMRRARITEVVTTF